MIEEPLDPKGADPGGDDPEGADPGGDDPVRPDEPPRRRPEPIELLALAVGLAPVVTVFVWALVTGWVPLGDSGQLTVRSRDVFTVDHPLVGAWSSRSSAIDGDINNLGSLQLVLLAPFTRLDPYWGSALGAAVLAAGAVTGVWAAARSVFGRLGAVGSMLATLVLIASMGNVALLETRQQLAMLLPFWCLLWAVVALWRGRAWVAPLVVLAASLVIQTHFTFVLQAVVLTAAGAIAFVVGARTRWRDREVWRPLLIAAAVGLLCWAPTVWDQFFGRGNLGKVAGQSGAAGDRAGLTVGVELASDFALGRPFWMPGSMGRPGARRSGGRRLGERRRNVVAHHRGLGAGGGRRMVVGPTSGPPRHRRAGRGGRRGPRIGGRRGHRHTRRGLRGLPGAELLLALAGRVAAGPGPPLGDRVVAPLGHRVALRPAAGARWLPGGRAPGRGRRRFDRDQPPRPAGQGVVREADSGPVVRGAVRRRPRRPPGPGRCPGEDRRPLYDQSQLPVLAELQRRGIPFTFAPGDGNLFRFGPSRCADGSIRQQITFSTDADPARGRKPGSVVLARIDSSPTRRRRLARLDQRAADAMRSGAIELDLDQVEPRFADDLGRVLRDPERSAAGLVDTVAFLASEEDSGVRLSDEAETLVTDWRLAARRVSADQATLTLTTRSAQSRGVCP